MHPATRSRRYQLQPVTATLFIPAVSALSPRASRRASRCPRCTELIPRRMSHSSGNSSQSLCGQWTWLWPLWVRSQQLTLSLFSKAEQPAHFGSCPTCRPLHRSWMDTIRYNCTISAVSLQLHRPAGWVHRQVWRSHFIHWKDIRIFLRLVKKTMKERRKKDR